MDEISVVLVNHVVTLGKAHPSALCVAGLKGQVQGFIVVPAIAG